MSNGKKFGVKHVVMFSGLSLIVGAFVAILYAFLFLIGPRTGGNSPVQVGGGAMAFVTNKNNNPWQVETKDGQGNVTGYCTSYAASKISFDAVLNADSNAPNPVKVNGQAWSMDVYGATPASDPPTASTNGVHMVGDNKGCNGTAGWAIHLSLDNNAAFYPAQVSKLFRKGKDGSSYVRFEDTTPSTCSGPNGNPNGDEDSCEQLTSIANLTVSGSQPTTQPYICQNVFCAVEIGQ